jgi:peptidoglycan hydrolase CwlO-like protein
LEQSLLHRLKTVQSSLDSSSSHIKEAEDRVEVERREKESIRRKLESETREKMRLGMDLKSSRNDLEESRERCVALEIQLEQSSKRLDETEQRAKETIKVSKNKCMESYIATVFSCLANRAKSIGDGADDMGAPRARSASQASQC